MQHKRSARVRVTGHLQVDETQTGRRYKALWRDADGRHQKVLGPAWVKPSGKKTARGATIWRAGDGPKPSEDYLTPAEASVLLRDVLAAAPGVASPRIERKTFGEVAGDWFTNGEKVEGWKPTTRRDYRSALDKYLLPQLGPIAVDELTARDVQRCLTDLPTRTRQKARMIASGILERAQEDELISRNVVAEKVKPVKLTYGGEIQVFSPHEIWALVRCAESGLHRTVKAPAGGVHSTEAAQQQRAAEDVLDAAIYLTAAFTGLRLGELLALRWRDVDFTDSVIRVARSYAAGEVTTPKSGKVRSVPMAPDVAAVLAKLGQRDQFTGDDDLVFAGETGSFLDGSALRRRYKKTLKKAKLRPLRLHDLRHTFASQVIGKADIRRVQEWMGHSDVQTTSRYLHYAPRKDDAQLVADAFALEAIDDPRHDDQPTSTKEPDHA